MSRNWHIPRRTFLKGLGTCISLPLLEAMVRPMSLLAETPGVRRPLRMGFIYVPNGANMVDWTPSETGTEFDLPSILEPLADVRSELQVLTGLAHQKAFANGDGAGDHARANATFLTGCQARKTAGADIRAGVSVDQVAAARIGRSTRLPSLELSCDKGQKAGACDSGYACAYQFHLSWRTESVPNPAEVNPRQVFERLFGGGVPGEQLESRVQREQTRKSVLDFALDDARRLRQNLGRTDQRKLDEYLSSVRDLEMRLENAEKMAARMPETSRPDGIPQEYGEHMRLMFDLLALAYQTDSTRIATFALAHDGSNRPYPFIGVSEGHHDLSHHEGKAEKKEKIAKINRFHMTQFAYFLKRLKEIKEGDGSLLDNCMVVYGSGIADGNAHNHDNLPVLLAGKGGGTLHPGRHVKFHGRVPMTNLYLSMLDRMGATTERLGDSTGRLSDI
jgi:hypothetical protein